MKVQDHSEFLRYVQMYVTEYPDVSAVIHRAIIAGIQQSLEKAYERAADMEICVAVLAEKRFKQSDPLLLDKLTKWSGKTNLKWDWLIDRLSPTKGETK